MSDDRLSPVSWQEVAEYVAAGSLVQVHVAEDFTEVVLEVLYGSHRDQQFYEASITLSCLNCAYVAFSRVSHHEPGSGIILEAYLHRQSPLLEEFFSNKLEGKAGSLVLQDEPQRGNVLHLEIIGEVSINVICQEFEWSLASPLSKLCGATSSFPGG